MKDIHRQSFPDEAPTKPVEHVHSRTLAFASRVERLAEVALERLQVAGDTEGACLALVQLRTLAGAVGR